MSYIVGKRPLCRCQQKHSLRMRACVQPDKVIIYLSVYTASLQYSVSRQLRPRSACANAQADQVLYCPILA